MAEAAEPAAAFKSMALMRAYLEREVRGRGASAAKEAIGTGTESNEENAPRCSCSTAA